MAMSPDQHFDILKIELGLIQATLDKYDDLIFRGRNFFITLWLACVGLSFTLRSSAVPWLAVGLAVLYWFLEGLMRHQYWLKYVDRYRFLRCQLNDPKTNLSAMTVYDLTDHFNAKSRPWWSKVRTCFFKVEPTVLYGVMGVAALVLWLLLRWGILIFPK